MLEVHVPPAGAVRRRILRENGVAHPHPQPQTDQHHNIIVDVFFPDPNHNVASSRSTTAVHGVCCSSFSTTTSVVHIANSNFGGGATPLGGRQRRHQHNQFQPSRKKPFGRSSASRNNKSPPKQHEKNIKLPPNLQNKPPPTDVLFTLIKSQKWSSVLTRCTTHPQDATYVNVHTNWTPLHLVCSFGSAPSSVVEAVFESWPGAVLIQDFRAGDTPLHVQCRNSQRSVGKVAALLRGRGGNGEVGGRGVGAAVECTAIRNKLGQTPLHVACDSVASLPVLRTLVDAAAGDPPTISATLTCRDYSGATPLSNVYNSYVSSIPGHLAVARILNEGVPSRGEGHFLRFWDKICFLAVRAYVAEGRGGGRSGVGVGVGCGIVDGGGTTEQSDVGGSSSSRLLAHAILTNRHGHPRLLQIALTQDPTLADVADVNGNLPLHVVAARGPFSGFDSGGSGDGGSGSGTTNRGDRNSDAVIDLLVKLRPSAALARNTSAGRAPLHLAIERGLGWNDGLGRIVFAGPSMLGMQDPVTRLYPFMLAASSESKCSDSSVDTAFRLLQCRPDLVGLC